MSEGKMSAGRALDYIDARQMAKAMARWRVAGDLSDEQLQEDSVSCRYLNRRIAELTEDYVPYAVAAIKALGAEPVDVDTLQREADGLREALGDLIETADGTLAMLEAKRKAGDFDHWESFEMSDFAVAIDTARAALNGSPQAEASGGNKP